MLDTLAKPFDFAVLEERVMACLDRADELVAAAAPSAGLPAPEEDEEGWVEITPARRPGESQEVG